MFLFPWINQVQQPTVSVDVKGLHQHSCKNAFKVTLLWQPSYKSASAFHHASIMRNECMSSSVVGNTRTYNHAHCTHTPIEKDNPYRADESASSYAFHLCVSFCLHLRLSLCLSLSLLFPTVRESAFARLRDELHGHDHYKSTLIHPLNHVLKRVQ